MILATIYTGSIVEHLSFHVLLLIVIAIVFTLFSMLVVGTKNWKHNDYKELAGFIVSIYAFAEVSFWIVKLIFYLSKTI